MSHDSKPIHEQGGVLPAGKNQGLRRTLRNLMFASLGLLVALNLFITPHDPHFGLDQFPGFWALFGLLGAVILVKGAIPGNKGGLVVLRSAAKKGDVA